jgi:hypothetical protein
MALQTVRVIVLLAIGPQIARWVAGTLGSPAPQPEPPGPPDLGDLD